MKAHDDIRISFSSFGEIPSFKEGDSASLSGDNNSNRDMDTVATDCTRIQLKIGTTGSVASAIIRAF